MSESIFEPSKWGYCLQKKGECLQARQSGRAVKSETRRLKEWKTEYFKAALRNNLQQLICLYISLLQPRVPFQFTPCQKCSFPTNTSKETFSWFLTYRNHTFLTKCRSAWPLNKLSEKTHVNSVSIAHSEPIRKMQNKWPSYQPMSLLFSERH